MAAKIWSQAGLSYFDNPFYKDLTEKQKAVFDLRKSTDPPMKWEEITRRLGLPRGNAYSHFKRAELKLAGGPNQAAAVYPKQQRTVSPDRVETIDALTDPMFESVRKAALETGLGEKPTTALMHLLQTKFLPMRRAIQKVKTETLVGLLEGLAKDILEKITDADIDEASLRDKMVALGIAIDKRQLLQNLPTQILTVQDERHMLELVRVGLQEAHRRGIVIDVTQDAPRVAITGGAEGR